MGRKTSFYLLTDTHFVSKRTWVEGKPFTMRERGDQIALKASPEILDAFFEKILADKETDTVIFTGDNVNNGDMNSHEDFRAKIEKLVQAGKKVYVTTATHDYCGMGDDENFFTSSAYTETGTEPTPCMRKADLFDYYYDYGPKQALSVHRESGSYTVQLGDGVRMVLINDNGNGRSHCGLFEDGTRWLTEQIEAAKSSGNYVLLAVHHPVIAPFEAYRHMVEFELYGGYRELWKLMCETGVRVVFTGHTHVQNIRKYTDEEGRWFLDISTTAAVSAKGKMRFVTVDADAGICDVKSIGIEHLPGIDTGGKDAYHYLYELNLPGRLEYLLPLADTDFDAFLRESEGSLPKEKMEAHKRLTKFALKKIGKLKLSALAKLGGSWRRLTPEQKQAAKNTPVLPVALELLRHIFPGNAPYTPDTLEYTVLHALMERAGRFVEKHKIEKVQKLIPPGMTLAEMGDDFLYNNRTGDDDAICFEL